MSRGGQAGLGGTTGSGSLRQYEQTEGHRPEEQGKGYSPDGQRQAIARYAAEHGLDLLDEYLDFESGRAAEKRAAFQRLIEDAIAGRFDCVLVFHSSRFARNTIEAKRYKKLLREELGIDVVSVTQPLGGDADDPAAFLAESVDEIFDEYYSVSLSFWTKMGLKEKARQGILTGSLPWTTAKGQMTSQSLIPIGRPSLGGSSSSMRPAATPTAPSPSG